MRNLLCQLNSRRAVTELWERRAADPAHGGFRAVVYARPDLRYLDDLDVVQLLARDDDELFTPYWDPSGGLNDRFAYGAPRAAAAYGRRLERALEYVSADGDGARPRLLHAERFLAWAMLREEPALALRTTAMRAMRVRSNGRVQEQDVCLPDCEAHGEVARICAVAGCETIAEFGRVWDRKALAVAAK